MNPVKRFDEWLENVTYEHMNDRWFPILSRYWDYRNRFREWYRLPMWAKLYRFHPIEVCACDCRHYYIKKISYGDAEMINGPSCSMFHCGVVPVEADGSCHTDFLEDVSDIS